MSDQETEDDEKNFFVDRAKQGRANCKKCKEKLLKGDLRLARISEYNPYGPGKLKLWYHVNCMFESFKTAKATTKKIECSDDIGGWDLLTEQDRDEIMEKIEDYQLNSSTNSTKNTKNKLKTPPVAERPKPSTSSSDIQVDDKTADDKSVKDNLFKEFRKLCFNVSEASSYLTKTSIIHKQLSKGCDGKKFKGNMLLWIRLLLPGSLKRIYNLQSKQLVKLFSVIFQTDHDDMLNHLERGDVAESISYYFENSSSCKPASKSLLTLKEVDIFLDKLTKYTKEDQQIDHLQSILKKCTSNDLKMIIRLIKHDLRINAGPKHILAALHPEAFMSYQASRDISAVVQNFGGKILDTTLTKLDQKGKASKNSSKSTISLMVPVAPMLAEACKSVEQAMTKCPNGMYSEVKYDGERVQLHKQGDDFKFFSRSLKPVLPHKVDRLKKYIPDAFPDCDDIILDSEVLMIDTKTNKPLPFGSLGKHKKDEFKNAEVCLFVFDCLYYNGEVLINRSMKERREFLEKAICPVQQHVVLSEMEIVSKPNDLSKMIALVLKQGLEGLVLKDVDGIYEPGKRHWLKVKKDYLFDGAMADSADLVVLGAWFGTGKKGGMMSVFLMGCQDQSNSKWLTVTKVHTGHDDATLSLLQKELDKKMVKISGEYLKVPDWLRCHKGMVPDFVAADPNVMPVWEITGAEFSKADGHTADGISIRFPRVTRIRDDKTPETATNLQELHTLYKNSKENVDYSLLTKGIPDTSDKIETEKVKNATRKASNPNGNAIGKYLTKEDKTKATSTEKDSKTESNSKSNKLKVTQPDIHDNSRTNSKNIRDQNRSPFGKQENNIKGNGHAKEGKEKFQTNTGSSSKRKSDDGDYPHKKRNKIETVKPSGSKGNESLQESDSIHMVIASKKTEPENPLPDIFKDISIFLPDELKQENAELLRIFKAGGGTENDVQSATHIIHGCYQDNAMSWDDENDDRAIPGKKKWIWNRNARHVSIKWLEDCVLKRSVVDVCPHIVILRTGN